MSSDNIESNALIARLAAFETIDGVLNKKRDLDSSLRASITYSRADPRSRAFAGFLSMSVLKRLGQIDAMIDHCVQDPLPRKARSIRDVLRLGIVQLLFSETAPHAAISTSVDMCRAIKQEPFTKLVNAVLRRLQKEGPDLIRRQDAARLNTPSWLWDAWENSYGAETTQKIAAQHIEAAPLDLTVRSEPAMWAERLGGDVILDGTVRLHNAGDVSALDGFEEGAWWVQDAAARLPVALLGDISGKHVIDLCAAPGGKTMELCAAGARVTALDISEKRLARVQENLSRTKLAADLIHADARDWSPSAPADLVLLDAPCSSTGTLRRHPDVGWLKSKTDVSKLATVQDVLLDRAIKMIVPGGTLLYVTCSLQAEEGPDRIQALLARTPSVSRAPFTPADLPHLPDAITSEGDLRTLPHFLGAQGGMDGFFASRLLIGND